jgi:two-component system nitrate/nitrite response regulator NarL
VEAGPYKVLVVDDDEGFVELLRRAIGRLDRFDVVGTAFHGADGVSRARELQPDIIVLDRKMPVMDGIEALPRLKTEAPAAKIVLYAADVDDNFSLQAISLGADAVVSKLEPIGSLFQAMDRALGAI